MLYTLFKGLKNSIYSKGVSMPVGKDDGSWKHASRKMGDSVGLTTHKTTLPTEQPDVHTSIRHPLSTDILLYRYVGTPVDCDKNCIYDLFNNTHYLF